MRRDHRGWGEGTRFVGRRGGRPAGAAVCCFFFLLFWTKAKGNGEKSRFSPGGITAALAVAVSKGIARRRYVVDFNHCQRFTCGPLCAEAVNWCDPLLFPYYCRRRRPLTKIGRRRREMKTSFFQIFRIFQRSRRASCSRWTDRAATSEWPKTWRRI